MTGTKILTTCDACRVRKVRCLKQRDDDLSCINCHRRGENCQFSRMKRRRTQNQSSLQSPVTNASVVDTETTALFTSGHSESRAASHVSTTTPTQSPQQIISPPRNTTRSMAPASSEISLPSQRSRDKTPELCIDRILKGDQEGSSLIQQSVFMTSNGHVASSTVAFWSESKIKTMSDILGHDALGPLIKGVDDAISAKLKGFVGTADTPMTAGSPLLKADINEGDMQHAQAYLDSFFLHVHPMYPFLDREQFEKTASRPDLNDPRRSIPWQALYYAVLGLGSLYHNGGSFLPGEGLSWKFFQASLNLMPELLLVRRTIETAQALIAMAIFAQMHASLPVDEIPVNEAARIVISLGLGKRPKRASDFQNRARAFWVVYCMEKDFAFNVGRSSLINDCDIACPLPSHSDNLLAELDWVRAWASFSRLLSKAYDSLFSVSAANSPRDVLFRHIDHILADLEAWKDSLPQGFRPGSAIKLHLINNSTSLVLTVRIHFWFYNLRIAISRLALFLSDGENGVRQSQSKLILMHASRSIIDLTNFLAIEPFTPSWMLTHMPMVAVFIVAELSIHNPVHRETTTNLTYLDLASGYFARMQMTQGADRDISISMLQLIRIVRDHVQSSLQKGTYGQKNGQPVEPLAAISASDSPQNRSYDADNSQARTSAPRWPQQTDADPWLNSVNMENPTGFQIDTAIPNTDFESLESLVFPIDNELFYNTGINDASGYHGNDMRFLDFLELRRHQN